ncbi:ATP-grasp domain-containing protein [Patescibacteria group bacterium]|nr:ATP-grasp domain-containing protein [Patescibacteria group bacterium]
MQNDNVKFKNIISLINASGIGPIFFVAPNPSRAIGLEKEIKNYHIICSQNSDAASCLKKEKVEVFCLDNGSIKNSGKILENKKVISYIKKKSKDKKANIITSKPSPKLQKICDENKFRYLGNDWKLNRKFEDKVEFVNITNKLKIPNAQSKVAMIEGSNKFKEVFNSEGKYVVQLPRGFSGNSTFLVSGKNDLDNIIEKYKNRKVKIAKYLSGGTYTVNACVTKFGIAVSQPIFQITGLTAYNKNSLGTSGNDYARGGELGSEQKKKIFDYTKKIGKYMRKSGYKGWFGLDFVVGKKSVDLIEINPRFTASVGVFTKLQMQNRQIQFLFLHLAEFLDINYKSELLFDYVSFAKWNKQKNFSFSQLILRNTKKGPVKVAKSMVSGIYRLKNGKLILKKKTYYAQDLRENEFLIQAAEKGSLINPDMEYANIQIGCGTMKDGRQFNSYFNNIIRIVLKNIKMSI